MPRLTFPVFALAAVMASLPVPAGAHGGNNKLVHACIHPTTTQVRIVSPITLCVAPETALHWSIAGPRGAMGAQGPAGPEGVVGPRGATGKRGAPGLAGPAGPAGTAGPAGPAGPTGKTGPAGLTGKTGEAGPAGPAGLKGKTGATGKTGAAGAIGATGPAGPQGPAGAGGAPVTRGVGDFGTVVPAALGVTIDFAGIGVLGADTMSGIGFTVKLADSPVTDVEYRDYAPGQVSVPAVTFAGVQGTAMQIHDLDSWVHDTLQGNPTRKSVTIAVIGTDGSTRLSVTLVDCMVVEAQAYDFMSVTHPALTYGHLTLQPGRIQLNTLVFKSGVASGAPSRVLAALIDGDPELAEVFASGEVVPAAGTEGGITSMQVNVQRGIEYSLVPRSLQGGMLRFERQAAPAGSDRFVQYTLGKKSIDALVLTAVQHGNGTALKAWINGALGGNNPLDSYAQSVQTQGLDSLQTSIASLTYTDVFLSSVTFIGPDSAAGFATLDLTLQAARVTSP